MRAGASMAVVVVAAAFSGCGAALDDRVGSAVQAMTCFVTGSDIRCVDGADVGAAEAGFPSVCVDADSDEDGTPDFVDRHDDGPGHDVGDDHHGGSSSDDGVPDGIQCWRCDRGPGEPGDFRLDVDGTEVELKRGTVVAVEAGVLSIAATDGVLLVRGAAGALPGPGAEVRVRGTLDAEGALVVERFEVLCPGPGAAASVPEGAEAVHHHGEVEPGDDAGDDGLEAEHPEDEGEDEVEAEHAEDEGEDEAEGPEVEPTDEEADEGADDGA